MKDELLPPGDYVVVRTTLARGRVLLVYVPECRDDVEEGEIARELNKMAQDLSGARAAPPELN